jgi:hypothetical protein
MIFTGGIEMFLHFDSDGSTMCDNCGKQGTTVHMTVTQWDRSLHLCISCFTALAQVIGHASQKLLPQSG